MNRDNIDVLVNEIKENVVTITPHFDFGETMLKLFSNIYDEMTREKRYNKYLKIIKSDPQMKSLVEKIQTQHLNIRDTRKILQDDSLNNPTLKSMYSDNEKWRTELKELAEEYHFNNPAIVSYNEVCKNMSYMLSGIELYDEKLGKLQKETEEISNLRKDSELVRSYRDEVEELEEHIANMEDHIRAREDYQEKQPNYCGKT